MVVETMRKCNKGDFLKIVGGSVSYEREKRNFQREERGVRSEIRLQSASALAEDGLLRISYLMLTISCRAVNVGI